MAVKRFRELSETDKKTALQSILNKYRSFQITKHGWFEVHEVIYINTKSAKVYGMHIYIEEKTKNYKIQTCTAILNQFTLITCRLQPGVFAAKKKQVTKLLNL